MASRRAFLRLSIRSSASVIVRKPFSIPRTSLQQGLRAPVARASAQQIQQIRWHSAPSSKSKVYDYDKIKDIVEAPTDDVVLIDVREPAEYEAGYIPTAINIPISSQPDALFLAPDEFQDRFGFMKPPPQKELVFYCKAGVRSSAAAQLALQHGYDKVGEYRGSWLDWTKMGGMESTGGPGEHKGGEPLIKE